MKFEHDSHVIEIIREIRNRKNVHQGDIANALNITVSAYNRIEKDKTQLTVEVVFYFLFLIRRSVVISKNYFLVYNCVFGRDFQTCA